MSELIPWNLLSFWAWVLTGVITLVTIILMHQLYRTWQLPPGPFPLPIVGNILGLRGKGNELVHVLTRLQKKHKDMFTFWLGNRPSIFVCSWDLCHEALIGKRNDFSGRVVRSTLEIFLDGHDDAGFSDYGPAWETLRKVLSNAIRKYTMSENLADLVSDVVDRTTDNVSVRGKPVDAETFIYLIIYNILASSAFGVRFELDDPDFIELRKSNDDLNVAFGNGLPTDAIPQLKFFYRKELNEIQRLVRGTTSYIGKKLQEHEDTYQSGDIRDFTDAVLASREEAKAEAKECLQYLTHKNLINLLFNLFAAGTDTTRSTLLWLFLMITNQPHIQQKMQEEIDKNIGSRQPVQQDKASCPYIQAVIMETLRYRPVLDITLEHKTINDTELGGYKIPKDTSVFFYIRGPQIDSSCWKDPEKFIPERFLDRQGQYTNTRISNFMPFGLGRRSCPGEKLAIADMFLATARLLQKHSFELADGPGTADLTIPGTTLLNFPNPFKLIIKKRVL